VAPVNRFDDVQLDVAALLKEQDGKLTPPAPGARSGEGLGWLAGLGSRARLYGLGALVKLGLHRRLVYANLRLDWFQEFQDYWMGELGNRPIQPHDFYFLMGVYRQRLQSIYFEHMEKPELASDDKHLEAWRDPRSTYYLFAYTYQQALSPLRIHRFTRYLPRGGRVAEYGCGAAPVLTALARRYRHLDLELVGADIPHLLFHYARWKFRRDRFVTMVPIPPHEDAPLPGLYDVIFCLEVFEHLPRPIAALDHFHRALRPGGYLIFDFIRSDGTGLDTATALRDRLPALRSLLDRFEIVEGHVSADGSDVAPSVARKR
jgi:SAM-dependent methyltransferase